ncbi:hypothetical protein HY969_02050 [Candidatus Kaiserbacteria bacterium]|nr:hypothetical protein [Candidatus Kaiserbacteria bacterium]
MTRRVGDLCYFEEAPYGAVFEVCNKGYPYPFQKGWVGAYANPGVMRQGENGPWRLAPATSLCPSANQKLVVKIVSLVGVTDITTSSDLGDARLLRATPDFAVFRLIDRGGCFQAFYEEHGDRLGHLLTVERSGHGWKVVSGDTIPFDEGDLDRLMVKVVDLPGEPATRLADRRHIATRG